MSDSTFVQTMADLRRLQTDSLLGDSAARAQARVATLKRHGVTAVQLDSAGRALGGDVRRAQALFNAISRATDSTLVAPRDSAAKSRAGLHGGSARRRSGP